MVWHFQMQRGKHPKVFPLLFVNMMRAGEATGNVDDTLDRLASTLEKQYNIKKNSICHDLSSDFIAFNSSGWYVLMVFIVPTFMDAFKEMNLEMPLITVIVVGISDWLIQFWYLLILGLLVLVVGLHYFYKNNKEFHYAVNVFLLRMPIFGQLLQKDIIARMTRTLSTLFSVPILQALTIVERLVVIQ